MNTMHSKKFPIVALMTMLSVALLAGCERAEQPADVAENQARSDQTKVDEQPLGHVAEFDGFTVRANVSPTEILPDDVAQHYGIEADPDRVLLNVVVLESQPDRPQVPVSAELSAHYENLIGHVTVIDMRPVEADGLVSYIGTLDASAEAVFRFVITAQPEGTEQPLQMNFELQLPKLDIN